ncbi:hypothetical protein [Mycobacteroides abscessus]|uniref:hypothetical protein n=1 Tax=Mycobacteroides abscessus TaxID=36809 RepID=UPI000A9E2891|nr:hypothetical protein [Mycobacteroides abscessus]MBN7445075.1 hypothetical protein [Mycobacteroides abscessus subsp. abscessus]MBN7452985.1 hypothetical protein [Mycobacteroides abscessus subsp. abscessus]MDM1895942.1 hypothetical protein [Mycobacteroides abscessus]MDM1900979.1 hypothetical protein [Mycobacteroides abscessus]MDM1906264.1 hypothetical protein [Mycobacteroides abscessus]
MVLIEQISERTGQVHTDTTPIEQWVHIQRFIAARQSLTASGIGLQQREPDRLRH